MATFKKESGNWTQYRQLPRVTEVDFHYSEYGPRQIPYWEAMDAVREQTIEALQSAQQEGHRYVIFRHGFSTSRPGETTARSQVRSVMRNKIATPYIIRAECIQHNAVFVAAIRPKYGILSE